MIFALHKRGLEGGVGTAGDTDERHADAITDAIVSGKSAEPFTFRTLNSIARLPASDPQASPPVLLAVGGR